MDKRLNIIWACSLALFLGACWTTNYKPPTIDEPEKFQKTINASYDRVWDALIEYTSTKYFGIDNFDKASGLITMEFTLRKPSNYVDCGESKVTGSRNFEGPYADYIVKYGGKFSGRMNVAVKRIGSHQTRIRVNTRYVGIFSYRVRARDASPVFTTWAFDSGSYETISVPEPVDDTTGPKRTCKPTHRMERLILEAVEKLARDR